MQVLLLPHSPWWRLETINNPEFLPSSLKVLLERDLGSLSAADIKVLQTKQGGWRCAAEAIQGRGSQVRAAAGGPGLGLGTGKTKADEDLQAPRLAETESEQKSSCSAGENKQKQATKQ